jgi:hypothetical protein
MPRIARLGRDVIVVFGATEYVAPVKIRLFHAEGNRFTGVAYRIAPNPDGGETWTPDAFNEVDLLEVVESIPSLRIISPGLPTILEVGNADLTLLTLKARQPQRRTSPWMRRQ